MENAVENLKAALAASQQREIRLQAEMAALRQQYADDLYAERQLGKQRQTQLHKLQDNYEQLRVRKGGFGFKMLGMTGFAATVGAVVLCWLYVQLKPRADHPALFADFRGQYQFNVEYALGRQDYQTAHRLLEEAQQNPSYRPIVPEIEFAEKLVKAAEQGCLD